MTPKLKRALDDGVEAIESLGLRYAVVGGLAVGAWAVPRATRDVGHREAAKAAADDHGLGRGRGPRIRMARV